MACVGCVSTPCPFGRLSGECVYYAGAYISGPGIANGDTLDVALNKLKVYIDIKTAPTSTTTTTTTTYTTTTTTSSTTTTTTTHATTTTTSTTTSTTTTSTTTAGTTSTTTTTSTTAATTTTTSSTTTTTTTVAPLTVFAGFFSSDPFPGLQTSDTLSYQLSQAITHNANYGFTFPSGTDANFFIVFKEPATETAKNNWNNGGLNAGTFHSDSEYHDAFVTGSFRYYVSRHQSFVDTTQLFDLSI